jgi:hypothetical protein
VECVLELEMEKALESWWELRVEFEVESWLEFSRGD